VVFRSHIDGAEENLTPERCMRLQAVIGADVIMQLDECPAGRATRAQAAEAVRRSAAWARRCRTAWEAAGEPASCPAEPRHSAQGSYQALFGIQQGAVYPDLRAQSAAALIDLDLPGYAVGGLGIGEGHEGLCEVLDAADEQLPADRPRYVMGIGEPRDILAAVSRGMDMFDCVLPTRNARNAQAFTWHGRLRLRNARWARDRRPIDDACDCYACRSFSRGAIRHLFLAREMLGPTLVTLHNLHFFCSLMAEIRRAIADGELAARARRWLDELYADNEPKAR